MVGFFVFFYPPTAHISHNSLPTTAAISYDGAWNYRQSINSCGPYSAAATIRALTQKDLSSEEIAQHIPWRFRGITLPFGILSILHDHHISTLETVVPFSDPQKLVWLREQLAQHHPVILLGKKQNTLHYVTVLGYATSTFDVYDSWEEKGENGLTIDHNGSASGNITLSDEELLHFWNAGGVFGLYKNYAIVATDVRTTSP